MRNIFYKKYLFIGLFLLFFATVKSQNGELILSTPDLSTWTCEVGEVQTFVWKYNYTLDGADKDCDDIDLSSVELSIGSAADGGDGDSDPTVEIVGGPSVSGCFVSLNFICHTDDLLELEICVNAREAFLANDGGVGCFDLSDIINDNDEEEDSDEDDNDDDGVVDSDGDGVADEDDCAPDDPNASSVNDPCDDGDANTINDEYDSNCNCIGEAMDSGGDGVVDSDGDGVADEDDCAPDDPNASSRNDACDDGNANTINDQYDSNCDCRGLLDSDGDGVRDEDDCAPNDPSASSINDACDDGDANTINDQYDSNCECRGLLDSDGDGVTDDIDCAPEDPNASSRNDACDDGNPNTINDQYDSNCDCRGLLDSDGDGVRDGDDCAPDDPNVSSRFDPCDDGNPNTVNDQYDSNCNCRGEAMDSDGDGVADEDDCAPNDPNASRRNDPCDDGDASTANDRYDSNCDCRGFLDSDGDGVTDDNDCAPDDPSASRRNDACDDGNPRTINDQYDDNCDCRGLLDSDGDGVRDINDCAPNDPNITSLVGPCDDGNPNTVNDQYDSNCNCRGEAVDSDGDGVADDDDCAPNDPNASSSNDGCDDGDASTINDRYDSNCNCRGEEEPSVTFGPSESVVIFDLDECYSRLSEGADDYSEFTADHPNSLDCATFSSSTLHRANPNRNEHSCTPGAGGSAAMCVTARIECDYSKASEQAVVFEVQVDASDLVSITGLKFLEKAPEQFDWINGASGPNNYPTLYGVRITVDGDEVYFEDDISTTTEWTEESFTFDDILIDGSSTVLIEMLAYCPVGNGATASVWDIENVELLAACGSNSSSAIISGLVTAMDNTPLSDVILILEGNDFQQEHMTSANGSFDFGAVPMSTSYTLSASKKTDYLKGVSTLDLVNIEKHILGLDPLTDAFRLIAADINKDDRISGEDLVHLRKLILGIYEELPENDSYRFYDQNEVVEMISPWIAQEELHLSNIEDFGTTHNFSGIKIGDVNIMQIEKRSRGNSVLNYQLRSMDGSGENIIDFYFEEEEQFEAIQLNLFLKDAELGEFRSGQLELSNSNYNILDGHELRISQNFEEVLTFDSDEPLFSLVLNSNTTIDQLDLIQDIAINSEVYSSTRDVSSIELKPIDEISSSSMSLTVYPNPFNDELYVNFDLDIEQEVSIELFDLNGRKLYDYSNKHAAGKNIVKLDDIPNMISSSLLISRVSIGDKVYTNKIMQIEN